jgi:hypothetical protein
VPGDVVGMVVGLEDVLDRDAQVAREPQVLADLEPRIDDRGDARVLVADQIGGAAEVLVRDLPEDHAREDTVPDVTRGGCTCSYYLSHCD